MKRYRRRLPHWDIPEAPVFVTWRLWGSLPQERSFLPEYVTSGEAFAALDRLLDTTRVGPVYLREDRIAGIVSDHLRALVAEGLCSLDAYVVMPNHVHVLWTPHIQLSQLMHRTKGPTARWANELLGRAGKPFWQEEYFDRLVRNADEFKQIRRYIELNPVKAGLVAHPWEFPWSSACERESGPEGPRGLKSALR
jgi:REP element-mobilizing transposase RayT